MLNKYGTSQDNSTVYRFQSDGLVPDIVLTLHYEQNGLFAKIIDAPAEEAIKHGFEMNAEMPEAEELLFDTLDALDWEEKAATAIKWARLYGGAIIVMRIDDGGDLSDPLNRDAINGIDGMKVYERAIVQLDWTAAMYGEPQYYNVSSIGGFFTGHTSRCLVFKNGVLPEHTLNAQYRFWGLPEYLRIKTELRECSTSHGLGVKLLDRAVQAIYSMKGLADLLMTDDDQGEEKVLKRLQLIDKARGILNSIAIDADGENYDFKSVTFSGAKDIIDTTCNMLSAVTSIPQAILFGRYPAGMNSTGDSDLENYYNLYERIQRIMLYGNLKDELLKGWDEPATQPLPNADGKDTSASVGVLILNDTGEEILCGKRTDNKLVCGTGGSLQEGETYAQAAIRETQEEFGVTPLNLKRLGQITDFENGKYGEPVIYLCTEYEGEPKESAEIKTLSLFPIDEFEPEKIALFPPFAESLKFLKMV